MKDKMKTGEILKARRIELNLNQSVVATEVGFTIAFLSSIERGVANVPIIHLNKILEVLSFNTDERTNFILAYANEVHSIKFDISELEDKKKSLIVDFIIQLPYMSHDTINVLKDYITEVKE